MMRWAGALAAEFVERHRWPLKMTAWLVALLLAAWGTAEPVLRWMGEL